MNRELKKPKHVPEVNCGLRSNYIELPKCISDASGIKIFGKRIKSILFSTDVAIIKNTNADAVIAVYPFTPQMVITQSIILASNVPVFCGIGGGATRGNKCINIALHAEFQGATGVVLNRLAPNELIRDVKANIDIPVVVTIVSEKEDFDARIRSGVDILNVSGAGETANIIKKIREVNKEIPIIATGGSTDESIRKTIEAGANAITYTPPTSAEIFSETMKKYRENI